MKITQPLGILKERIKLSFELLKCLNARSALRKCSNKNSIFIRKFALWQILFNKFKNWQTIRQIDKRWRRQFARLWPTQKPNRPCRPIPSPSHSHTITISIPNFSPMRSGNKWAAEQTAKTKIIVNKFCKSEIYTNELYKWFGCLCRAVFSISF